MAIGETAGIGDATATVDTTADRAGSVRTATGGAANGPAAGTGARSTASRPAASTTVSLEAAASEGAATAATGAPSSIRLVWLTSEAAITSTSSSAAVICQPSPAS